MQVELKGITKAFGANQVLKGVDLKLEAGEVHALMGENGAGKSTLMNILTGLHKQDDGLVYINGEQKQYENPKEAEENGVSFIHQEMITWPDMTVLENMFMGKEKKNKFGWVLTKEMKQEGERVFKELGIDISFDRTMRTLSVGQQQLVEIAKTLLNDAEVIIMDEPTAALTDREIQLLFKIIRQLQKKNVVVVYISHRMEEIFEISNRVTVMRDGVSISTKATEDTDYDEIVRQMVGRDLEDYYPEMTNEKGDVVLEVNNLSHLPHYENISFKLHSGEILGFSGLMGAGRTEIMRGIFGIDPFEEGDILLDGEKITIKTPHDAVKKGIGFLTENRKEEGLILDFPVKDNISITAFEEFSNNGWIDTKEEKEFVELLVKRLTVKTAGIDLPVSALSGGNQQKVVLAKWIGAGSRILILDEPTRGVDVGAKREIYNLMKELAERGVAIIMVSSDLPEVMGVSNRVLVVHEGAISGELQRDDVSEERIMTLATGGK
ncbi:sugar ABC transporter ATP-binding protein [Alkalibacterium olivapovliticus]|uniref:Ribose transport system ATP-binding protein n=1 Tax=Alkalibacterium olivapovliticus TaxID=99907 RepID=A0A2T0W7C9_9LACT|nr:sugar ABC transporter ATP-binding protein [Alkalibacterium olivapovliticus]PRY82610.1 ribose transport system ATP-binding protein [Alkalibacterium olivapovliticus]